MSCLRSRAASGLSLLLLLLAACAHDPVLKDGVWRSEHAGFQIGVPAGAESDERWERFDLEGAVLAYRRDELETMSLQARCGRPVASPGIMARHLMAGIPERTLREAGPREVAGQSGWMQTFDARLGRTVRIKTLTLVAAGCAYDLLLVTEGEFEPAERCFDAWAESFTLTRAGAS